MTTTEPVTAQSAEDLTQDLLTRARDLVPLLRANSERTEQERRIIDENLTALREAGLLKLSLPRQYGGHELGLRDFMRISAELGRGCGSTAWVTTLLNTNLFTAAAFSEQAKAEVFGTNPNVVLSGVILGTSVRIKPVDGGYLISGQWGFATGCLHADWAVLGRVPTDNDQSHVAVLIPMNELQIRDTWHVVGMSGTGSNTLVASDVFVPRHRVAVFARAAGDTDLSEAGDASGWHDQAMRRAVLILGVAAPLLGLAQQAFEIVTESLNNGKPIAYSTYSDARKSPSTQLAMARAAHMIDSSWLHALRSADDLDTAEATRTALDVHKQMRVRTDTGYIAQQCRTAVETLLDVGGASSFVESKPLQRVWRDLEVASRHGIINPMMAQEGMGSIVTGAEWPIVWSE